MSGDSVTDSPPSFGASQHVRQQLSGKKINQQVNGDVEPLVLPYRQFFCQGKWDAAQHPKSSRLGDMGFAIWFAIWRCSAPYVCKIQHGVPRAPDLDIPRNAQGVAKTELRLSGPMSHYKSSAAMAYLLHDKDTGFEHCPHAWAGQPNQCQTKNMINTPWDK